MLELRQPDQHDDHGKRQGRRRDGPPQHGDQQEIEHAPGQDEGRLRRHVGLGLNHDDRGSGMQRDDEGDAPGQLPFTRSGGAKAALEVRNSGRHGIPDRARRGEALYVVQP